MFYSFLKKIQFISFSAVSLLAVGQHKPLGGFAYGEKNEPTGKEWESVEELALNKEYPRAYFFSFQDEKSATKVLPENSNYWLSLNGNWKFHWVKTPFERPKDFYKNAFDASSWDTIAVPSNWNIYGIQKDGALRYGVPIYVNQLVIFQHTIAVDDWRGGVMRTPPKNWTTYEYRNEVGSYIREFEVPTNWDGREIFVDFNGVDSFFYLWINGRYVGFSKNSRNVASFNITKFLQKGKNKIAVEVYRNSDGSFLEAQDMFRLPGIFRTVALRSTPKLQFYNLNILTDTDSNFENWQVKINSEIRNLDKKTAKDYKILYSIYENKLFQDDIIKIDSLKENVKVGNISYNEILKINSTISVKKPNLWSAEIPNRYVLVAKLVDKKGKIIDVISSYFGFRKVEIKDTKASEDEFGKAGRYFYVNGKTIKFKGVNRHETHPAQGHTLTHQQMEEEILLMKRANINHVRNSHYPPDPYWFYLCDKYGIYLENEANLESHEYYYGDASLSHPKEWEKAHIGRIVDMVEGYYNAPSIVIWSLGNEAGPGDNFKAAYKALKAIDTSRPVQYERNNDIVDMGSNQYPSVAWVQGAAEGKFNIKYPFHISEYAHSMGNAVGNLADYWQAIESSNYICGGAIWDWVDQAMYHYTKEGKQYLAYGGDFGDFPNDGQFVMNGLLFADRTPKPQFYEVKKVYQNIDVKLTRTKNISENTKTFEFQILNKNYFIDLSDYQGVWKIYKNGHLLEKKNFDISNIKERKQHFIEIPNLYFEKNAEYYVIFEFSLKKDMPWAKKGFVQANEQIILQNVIEKIPINKISKGTKLMVSTDKKTFFNDLFSVTFNFDKGTIQTLKYGENNIIENSNLELNAFRPFINNDGWAYEQWFEKGLHNLQHKSLNNKIIQNKNGSYSVYFSVESQALNGAKIHGGTSSGRNRIEEFTDKKFSSNDFKFITNQVFTIYPDGSIELQASITSNDASVTLPQLGFLVKLPKDYSNFTYYGRGKQDNYSDRKTGAFIGIYKGKVEDELVNFPKPQDMGQHQDTRWASLTNEKGDGAIFIPSTPISVAALPYSAKDLLLASHPHELPTPNNIYLQLNIATTGVGGNSCGPAPLDKDRVMASPHSFGIIIRPIKNNNIEATNIEFSPNTPISIFYDNLGKISLETTAIEKTIFYSINNGKSNIYKKPFPLKEKSVIKAWYADAPTQKYTQEFDKITSLPMKIIYVSSEEIGEGNATHFIDGNPNTIWHTAYSVSVAKYPHWIDFDLLQPTKIKGFSYLSRLSGWNGAVKDFSISISEDGKTWKEIHKGTFDRHRNIPKYVYFNSPVKTKYLRFTALSEQFGQDFASGAEFSIIPE
ncbi:MAG: glycoside hydrolase family 2 TIM barrel-domain containing protein [Capnocytophaga sp.]|nr:glycoside hydrolase family 2 TIM barrel-domain containing protein [Capnocytophaga sp.]